jgi:hypothetical protein
MTPEEKLQFIRKRAKSLNIPGMIYPSNRKHKKYMLLKPDGVRIHFGDSRYEDYIDHKDEKRRENYRRRHRNITLSNGKRAIHKRYSPAFLSFQLLW